MGKDNYRSAQGSILEALFNIFLMTFFFSFQTPP